MKSFFKIISALLVFFLHTSLNAADMKGSSDYPNIGRFKGSEIKFYNVENYGQTVFATGPVKKAADAEKTSLTVEGKITRIFYRIPKGVSALEVFRNFETKVKDANFDPIFSGGPDQINDYNFKYKHPVDIIREARLGYDIYYLSAVKTVEGRKIYLSVLASPHSGGDGVRVGMIVAETKAMEMQMLDAAKMRLDMTENGRVALYGIYFDHNSAKLKPASKSTLDEIVKLLTNHPDLRIIVVGHTDYIGGFDYNIDLSKRRAKTVMDELVKHYGIDETRIKSDGVGYLAPAATNLTDAGRALNRRVELVQDK